MSHFVDEIRQIAERPQPRDVQDLHQARGVEPLGAADEETGCAARTRNPSASGRPQTASRDDRGDDDPATSWRQISRTACGRSPTGTGTRTERCSSRRWRGLGPGDQHKQHQDRQRHIDASGRKRLAAAGRSRTMRQIVATRRHHSAARCQIGCRCRCCHLRPIADAGVTLGRAHRARIHNIAQADRSC